MCIRDRAKDQESFKDYILGKRDNQPKTPQWAEKICDVKAADIEKLAKLYATTKPAALKASWAPGRNAYGEQYNRMAAALQAMTGNIGVLGGCAEGVGKAWHGEAVAYPYDQYANIWYASIKSDRWAHCVLNYPDVKREEIGLWPRGDQLDGAVSYTHLDVYKRQGMGGMSGMSGMQGKTWEPPKEEKEKEKEGSKK